MGKATGAERNAEMLSVLREWQSIERSSMSTTTGIMESTASPLVRIVMEVIRHDSLMHHRVQQFLIDSLTERDVAVTREDVAQIWEQIEEHDALEQKTIRLAEGLRDQAWSPIHRRLLDYLIEDEKKHDRLLTMLNEIKTGMSLASGA
jgi:hypothetical protein